MRHIPEDELHAYLDQALSRSQCVEIECHLAECRRCQIERNAVAAVRDRITALLVDATPKRIQIPAYEQIVAQHHARKSARLLTISRMKRVGLLAAGIAAAIGANWLTQRPSSTITAPTAAAQQEVAEAPVTPPASGRTLVAVGPVTAALGDSAPSTRLEPTVVAVVRGRTAPIPAPLGQRAVGEPVLQVNAITSEDEPFVLDGLWQAVDLRQAMDETAGNLPRIDSLPIVDIQLQRGAGDQRPTVVVSQQHPSGRIIRTIEGPVDRVEELIEKLAIRGPAQWRASVPAMTPPDYLVDGTTGAKRGLRMLTVTGSLPADSLNTMAKAIEVRD